MSIFDRIFSLTTPYECVVCNTEGSLLCQGCSSLLSPPPNACYSCCVKSNIGCGCDLPLKFVYAATSYSDELAKKLVWRIKYGSTKAVAPVLAHLINSKLVDVQDYLIAPTPTTTRRARQRGYDQAKLIAKALSNETKLRYLDCLARSGAANQVGSSRQQRSKQVKSAFRVRQAAKIKGRHILLVDDVLTTGATLEAAAKTLLAAGAASVGAAVFAQTPAKSR